MTTKRSSLAAGSILELCSWLGRRVRWLRALIFGTATPYPKLQSHRFGSLVCASWFRVCDCREALSWHCTIRQSPVRSCYRDSLVEPSRSMTTTTTTTSTTTTTTTTSRHRRLTWGLLLLLLPLLPLLVLLDSDDDTD